MAKKMSRFEHNPSMLVALTYVVLLLCNVVVLYFAQMWFPQHIVLGTITMTATWALWMSMGKLALIGILTMPFLAEWEHRRSKLLTPAEWMISYLIINFVGLWGITRFSQIYGLGVTSWMVVASLALVINAVQGAAMMKLEKWRTS